jgi:hypothetical protein
MDQADLAFGLVQAEGGVEALPQEN